VKPLTSTPPVDEICSITCVVAPTSPIFSPFFITIAEGTIFPFWFFASSSPAMVAVSIKLVFKSASPLKSRFADSYGNCAPTQPEPAVKLSLNTLEPESNS